MLLLCVAIGSITTSLITTFDRQIWLSPRSQQPKAHRLSTLPLQRHRKHSIPSNTFKLLQHIVPVPPSPTIVFTIEHPNSAYLASCVIFRTTITCKKAKMPCFWRVQRVIIRNTCASRYATLSLPAMNSSVSGFLVIPSPEIKNYMRLSPNWVMISNPWHGKKIGPTGYSATSVIPGMSINFSCTSSGTAANLSRMDLQLFGHTVMIARFSSYASRYWVALARLSDHVDDTLIYKWFASRGSPPSSIAATIQVNGIASQKRTVHFEHDPVPPCLMNDAIPVREIYFALDDSSTQEQRPCIVTHRIQRYNQVPPPSLTKPTDPHPTAPTAPISGPSNRPVSSPSADHLPSSAFGRKHGS